MIALALLLVFILAKVLILARHGAKLSLWSPIALFWQDVLVALVFGLLISFIPSRRTRLAVYGVCAAYVTINVAVERVLFSPLTWPMINAARGALSDSIRHHATPDSLMLMLLVATAATAMPLLLGRLALKPLTAGSRFKQRMLALSIALVFAGLGPLASSKVDTNGLDRNAIAALFATALPRISARADVGSVRDWRTSPFDDHLATEDLSCLDGKAKGRNVVLIALESAASQYLGIYGASNDPMPTLSQLATESIVFENAYSVYPESIKGLFSVLCSRYPAIDTSAESYARFATPSLPVLLRENGYRTALFHSGRFMYLGMDAVVKDRGYEVLEDAGAIGGNYESSFGVDEASTVSRALDWIDSLGPSERFLLTYLPIAGHHPYNTPSPGPFPERDEKDRYLNALHYADASLGMLLDGLRTRGLDKNTLFVIYGDHGEAFGQHEGNFGHSFFLWEENVHVPYFIAAPGLIAEERRVRRPVSLIDTAPTILTLLGIGCPSQFQGSSMLSSRSTEGHSQAALFLTDYSLVLIGIRDGKWKCVYDLGSGRSKLFDLWTDPKEENDLSRDNQQRVVRYRELLLGWSAAQKSMIESQLQP